MLEVGRDTRLCDDQLCEDQVLDRWTKATGHLGGLVPEMEVWESPGRVASLCPHPTPLPISQILLGQKPPGAEQRAVRSPLVVAVVLSWWEDVQLVLLVFWGGSTYNSSPFPPPALTTSSVSSHFAFHPSHLQPLRISPKWPRRASLNPPLAISPARPKSHCGPRLR